MLSIAKSAFAAETTAHIVDSCNCEPGAGSQELLVECMYPIAPTTLRSVVNMSALPEEVSKAFRIMYAYYTIASSARQSKDQL